MKRLGGAGLRGRICLLFGGLMAFNGLAWLWAAIALHTHATLMALALLAYTFGLRHAVDADHIAAIDNVTRRLMHAGQRPVASGLFFSLGHATVVLVASVALGGAARATRVYLERHQDVVGIVGTAVSVVLLLLVALMNASILVTTLRAPGGGEGHVQGGGLLARLCQPLFRLVTRSWHMCVLGLLFGLGFDTATEIGVLGLSAAEAANGLSMWAILSFPLLFAAGMSLVDTLDSTLMVGAYGWAFVEPARKASYNVTLLALSVGVALVVGGVEALGLLGGEHATDALWRVLTAPNRHPGTVGYLIVLVFLACWLISLALHRTQRTGPEVVASLHPHPAD
jgi:nickel/cobalt transporter (NiCoT) family protein